METPKHLSHTPIVSWNDYHRKDGKFANKTDAMALSIGYAQYDKKERNQINLESDNRVRKQDISMKVWRKPGDRWSRQSEELPIHRNLDLTILLLSVLTNSMQSEMSVDMEGGIGVIQKFCSTEVDNGEIQNRLTKIHDLLNRYLNNV